MICNFTILFSKRLLRHFIPRNDSKIEYSSLNIQTIFIIRVYFKYLYFRPERIMKLLYLFSFLLIALFPFNSFAADEVNIALSRWGATATASSEFGPDYRAGNALDGLWTSREHHKWNSKLGETPHWLRIDFGHTAEIHRIVVRHEGVYGDGESFNTGDYRLQASDSPDGPWRDIVDPVRGNTEDVNDFSFPQTKMRYLRLFIEMGEQSANDYARIFEVEAWANQQRTFRPENASDHDGSCKTQEFERIRYRC